MTRADDRHPNTAPEQSDLLAHGRHQIHHYYTEARGAFKQMRNEQRVQWLALCHALAWDDDDVVRTFALRQLAFYGDNSDLEAEAAALDVLKHMPEKVREVAPEYPHRITPQRHLQIAALLALGHVGGAAAFPILFARAQAGDEIALRNAAVQAHTLQQQKQIVELARKFLQADEFHLAYQGLQALWRFSTPEHEQSLLLAVARKSKFDIIIRMLGHGNPTILPAVRELLSELPPHTVQHKAALEAIEELEQREQRMREVSEQGD